MSDDEDLSDKLKGGLGTAGKVTLLGGLRPAVGFKKLKETIIGDPPSPIRKTLVYGSAALALGYTACSDDLRHAGTKAYDYLEGKQAQRIETLEAQTERQARRLNDAYAAKDSVSEALNAAITQYNAALDSLASQPPTESTNDTVYIHEQLPERRPEQEPRHDDQPSVGVGDTAINPRSTHEDDDACWHPVQPGETLSEIANEYQHGDLADLLEANPVNPRELPIGYPVSLPGIDCHANTSDRPDYTVLKRDHTRLANDLDGIGDPHRLHAYNAAHGNDLTDTDPGERIAIYTP